MQDTIKNFKSKLFLHISHIMLSTSDQKGCKTNLNN